MAAAAACRASPDDTAAARRAAVRAGFARTVPAGTEASHPAWTATTGAVGPV